MDEKALADIALAQTNTTGQLTAFAETVQSVFVGAYGRRGLRRVEQAIYYSLRAFSITSSASFASILKAGAA